MRKTKEYIEWRNNIRKEKLKVAKFMFVIVFNFIDICI